MESELLEGVFSGPIASMEINFTPEERELIREIDMLDENVAPPTDANEAQASQVMPSTSVQVWLKFWLILSFYCVVKFS